MNSNQQPMLGKARFPHREGYICNCIHCRDIDYIGIKTLRSREKRSWKKDQDV